MSREMFTKLVSCLTCHVAPRHTIINRMASMSTNAARLHISPCLHISPSSALVDDVIDIRVSGLPPRHQVTLCGLLREGDTFWSRAVYTANKNGEVNVAMQSSVGGSYHGVEKMGLFWSMFPYEAREGTRLMKKDVTTPLTVRILVVDGHHRNLTPRDLDLHGGATGNGRLSILAEGSVDRWYMDKSVHRIPVRPGRIRGTLFLPPGDGPFPGVIDMFGTAGGLNEYRASLLASRGFAALALAFFAYDDLPEELKIDLDYFDEAVEYLYNHSMVHKGGIGTIGVSKGAELSLHMAAYNRKVTGAVSLNSYYYYSSGPHTLKGKVQPAATGPVMEDLVIEEDGINSRDAYWNVPATEDMIIPVEKAEGWILLICCEDDQMCTPKHADKIAERMKEHGKTNYRVIEYPGAGHLLEPPYMPYSRAAFHKLVQTNIVFGGEMVQHARAQETSWQDILRFLRANTGPNGTYHKRDSKL